MMKIITIYLILISFLNAGLLNTKLTLTSEQMRDQTTNYIKKLDVVILTEEPPHGRITCFDVNDDGCIALGISLPAESRANENTVVVYDPEMQFRYAVSFRTNGAYFVKYVQNELKIVLVRSDLCISFNEYGQLLCVVKLEQDESYALMVRDGYGDASLNKYGKIYELRNPRLTGYTELVCTEENGETHTLYEASTYDFHHLVFMVGFGLVALLSLLIIINYQKEIKREKICPNSDADENWQ